MTETIQTDDGPMLVHEFGDPQAPPVLVLMPAPGINAGLLAYAQALAGEGFHALVPDLYHRLGEELSFYPPTQQQEMMAAMGSLSDAMVVADVEAVLGTLDRPAGVVGFCMGGRFAVRAMAAFPDRVGAGSALHPSRLLQEGDDSPHLDIAAIAGPLYVGFGETDAIVPPAHWDAVREQVDRHGKDATIEIHPDAQHGFGLPGPNYQEAAAAASWSGTLKAFEGL